MEKDMAVANAALRDQTAQVKKLRGDADGLQRELEELRSRLCSETRVSLKATDVPGGLPLTRTGNQEYELAVSSQEEIPALVRRIVEAGGDIYHVSSSLPSLEDIYFALTAAGSGSRQTFTGSR